MDRAFVVPLPTRLFPSVLLALTGFVASCASSSPAKVGAAPAAPPSTSTEQRRQAAAKAPRPEPAAKASNAAPAPTPSKPSALPDGPDPALVARAQAIAAAGVRLYREGEYDAAEKALNQALALHPFLPEANLMLAKILLMRGQANSDDKLLASAKRMLEMALSLDPSLREAAKLLELFAPSRLE